MLLVFPQGLNGLGLVHEIQNGADFGEGRQYLSEEYFRLDCADVNVLYSVGFVLGVVDNYILAGLFLGDRDLQEFNFPEGRVHNMQRTLTEIVE